MARDPIRNGSGYPCEDEIHAKVNGSQNIADRLQYPLHAAGSLLIRLESKRTARNGFRTLFAADNHRGGSAVHCPIGHQKAGNSRKPVPLHSRSEMTGRESYSMVPLRAEYRSVRQFVLPHFLQPSQAIFAIKTFDECPHDRTPLAGCGLYARPGSVSEMRRGPRKWVSFTDALSGAVATAVRPPAEADARTARGRRWPVASLDFAR